MKHTKTLLRITLLLLAVSTGLNTLHAQNSKKDKDAQQVDLIKKLLDERNYVFKAQSALPMKGNVRQLSTDYDVRVGKDTIITYLPYFGRAFSAGYGTSGGISFTSKIFEYKVTERKKGGWEISIKPKDVNEVQQLNFTISENGYGILSVTSTNREPISFNGYIAKKM